MVSAKWLRRFLLGLLPAALTSGAVISLSTPDARARALVPVTTTDSPNKLACKFNIEDPKSHDRVEYDLCPLLSHHEHPMRIKILKETPPTRTLDIYTISLGGPLGRTGELPAELQCPAETWVCLIVRNSRPSRPSEPERITEVVPIVTTDKIAPAVSLSSYTAGGSAHPTLNVRLSGDKWGGQAQSALFRFECDHNSNETAKPIFVLRYAHEHLFRWKTHHACPKRVSQPDPDQKNPDPPKVPQTDEPVKWPDETPGQEFETVGPRHSIQRLMFGLMLISAAVFMAWKLLASSRRRRLVQLHKNSALQPASYRGVFINNQEDTEVVPLSPSEERSKGSGEDGKRYGAVMAPI
ncbi:hypothetical protein HGRIS_000352 [Hohenbuehelia grisea]|uniref:Autophagy-related protein 27 n=1 Tax=Hohenbuehelia grisea TaxID=104357 RepID=A0ABR3JQS7_9AGAR